MAISTELTQTGAPPREQIRKSPRSKAAAERRAGRSLTVGTKAEPKEKTEKVTWANAKPGQIVEREEIGSKTRTYRAIKAGNLQKGAIYKTVGSQTGLFFLATKNWENKDYPVLAEQTVFIWTDK